MGSVTKETARDASFEVIEVLDELVVYLNAVQNRESVVKSLELAQLSSKISELALSTRRSLCERPAPLRASCPFVANEANDNGH